MGIRQLRVVEDDILRKKAKPVKEISASILALIEDMWDTLRETGGIGLAAPQVGMLRRIVVMDVEEEKYELINPVIVSQEGEWGSDEACLSVPGYCGDVVRPLKIIVKAQNRDGESFTVEAEEYLASVFCHEIDHLDGVIYLDKATNVRPYDPDKEGDGE